VTVAALYVDPVRGPYPRIHGVECWGLPDRDALGYVGPHPVIAHPPCGHWGRYAHRCHDDGLTGPVAVKQVQRCGGVLEQPADSRLFHVCGLPLPGWLPDAYGGLTILVYQRDWGHPADKATWLYIVGVPLERLPPFPERQPPRNHRAPKRRLLVEGADPMRREAGTRGVVECMSKAQRHLTPPAFAAWLVDLASRVQR
jgi:hypothetical protein